MRIKPNDAQVRKTRPVTIQLAGRVLFGGRGRTSHKDAKAQRKRKLKGVLGSGSMLPGPFKMFRGGIEIEGEDVPRTTFTRFAKGRMGKLEV